MRVEKEPQDAGVNLISIYPRLRLSLGLSKERDRDGNIVERSREKSFADNAMVIGTDDFKNVQKNAWYRIHFWELGDFRDSLAGKNGSDLKRTADVFLNELERIRATKDLPSLVKRDVAISVGESVTP
jgi:hypothetical protein